ncbi:MAG: hypothetical protein H7Y11_06675 [Armatimonadetes bacterium]|nr:hypothetical protein [Anaerolineae bacterium]
MLSNDYIALHLTNAHQQELIAERQNDRLLKFVIREYKRYVRGQHDEAPVAAVEENVINQAQ